MLLGMAYGIYEEGLVVRSFFDPNWMDIGVLGSYGRLGGINCIWSISLTLFHAVVSIGLPILVVELSFPKLRDEPWLKTGGLVVCGVVFMSFLFLAPLLKLYSISALQFGLCVVCMAGLVAAARLVKIPTHDNDAENTVKGGTIASGYCGLMVMDVLGTWLLPALQIPAGVSFGVLAALPWLGVWLAKRWNSTAPGEMMDITYNFKAPNTPGSYQTLFKLQDDNGVNFAQFWVQFKVGSPTFAVTNVVLSAEHSTITGTCPQTFDYQADIKANGAGNVTYYLAFSDGSNSSTQTLSFNGAGTKTITGSWELNASGNSWIKLYVDQPNHQWFGPLNLSLTCTP